MSQTQQVSLPPEALNLLTKTLDKHKNVTMGDLTKEVLDRFNTRFIQQDQSYKDDNAKLLFCAKLIKGRYDNLIPYNPFDVVTVGIGPVRVTKSGSKRGELHVWTHDKEKGSDKGKDVLHSVVLQDRDTENFNLIQLFSLYKGVKLGRFSSGDFSADDRSIFKNPARVNMSPLKIFDKLGVRRCKISEVLSNVARQEGGYNKTTDYRVIRGIVISYKKGVSAAGKEWAFYNIYDASVDEDFTAPDGTVVKSILTVWCNPLWMVYEKDNELDFLGPITVYDKQDSMEAYCILPVHIPFGKQEA